MGSRSRARTALMALYTSIAPRRIRACPTATNWRSIPLARELRVGGNSMQLRHLGLDLLRPVWRVGPPRSIHLHLLHCLLNLGKVDHIPLPLRNDTRPHWQVGALSGLR